jgi:hypothetical protein
MFEIYEDATRAYLIHGMFQVHKIELVFCYQLSFMYCFMFGSDGTSWCETQNPVFSEIFRLFPRIYIFTHTRSMYVLYLHLFTVVFSRCAFSYETMNTMVT